MKRSGVSFMNSGVNGTTRNTSTPSVLDELGAPGQRGQLRRMAARDVPLPSGEGRTSSAPSAPRASRPALTAVAISSWCPRCTPSNTPIVRTHLPQSVGISSWPRQRCTAASLRRDSRATEQREVPELQVKCLDFDV